MSFEKIQGFVCGSLIMLGLTNAYHHHFTFYGQNCDPLKYSTLFFSQDQIDPNIQFQCLNNPMIVGIVTDPATIYKLIKLKLRLYK